MANIVLRIKPVEAEFARMECSTNVAETCGVLYTLRGVAIDPTKMAKQLSDSFAEFQLPIGISALRHALEAFSHKFPQRGSSWNGVFAKQANHNIGTSARYGRDENSFVGIPADLSEENFLSCNDWNTAILQSPSILSEESKTELFRQLEELDLLGSQLQANEHVSQTTQVLKRFRYEGEPIRNSEPIDQTGSANMSPTCDAGSAHMSTRCDTPSTARKVCIREKHTQDLVCLDGSAIQSNELIDRTDSSHMSSLCDTSPTAPTDGMRAMQKQAMMCLDGLAYSAIIIMPTGSGKTQLVLSHRKVDGCSVIFSPYNLLCRQLQSICQKKGTTVVWPLSTFTGSTDALLSTVEFVILPFEAAPVAHSFMAALHEKGRLGPIWIDEVRQ